MYAGNFCNWIVVLLLLIVVTLTRTSFNASHVNDFIADSEELDRVSEHQTGHAHPSRRRPIQALHRQHQRSVGRRSSKHHQRDTRHRSLSTTMHDNYLRNHWKYAEKDEDSSSSVQLDQDQETARTSHKSISSVINRHKIVSHDSFVYPEDHKISSQTKKNEKIIKIKNRKHFSNKTDHAHIGMDLNSSDEATTKPTHTFRIILGQVSPRKSRNSIRGQKLMGQNTKKLNASTAALSTTGFTKLSDKFGQSPLFEGVTKSKQSELAALLAEEDFETAIMEFIELAYLENSERLKSSKAKKKRRANATENAVRSDGDSRLSNRNLGRQESRISGGVNSRGIHLLDSSESVAVKCGLKLNYDATKLINLEEYFKHQILKTVLVSNSITSLFSRSALKEKRRSLLKDDAFLTSLLKTLLNADQKMVAAAVVFDPTPVADISPASPYVIKLPRQSYNEGSSGSGNRNETDLFVTDSVLQLSKGRHAHNDTKGYEWYRELRKDYSNILRSHKDICNSSKDNTFLEITQLQLTLSQSNLSYWGPIQSECLLRHAAQTPTGHHDDQAVWTVPFAVPIFGCGRLQTLVFLGALKADLDLTGLEFNQCPPSQSSPLLFHLAHNCPHHTQCEHVYMKGFRRGNYRCVCSPIPVSFLSPAITSMEHQPSNFKQLPDNATNTTNAADDSQGSYYRNETAVKASENDWDSSSAINQSTSSFGGSCHLSGRRLEKCYLSNFFNRTPTATDVSGSKTSNSCRECGVFLDDSGCPSTFMYDHHKSRQLADDYNYWMKGLPLGIQCFTILTGLTIAVVVARLKKNRVMVNSVWILLEFTVLGAIILHFSVILAYFDYTPTSCLSLIWCREIGFLLIYGSLLLKLHRTMSEFQSRKAHRVLWRNKDLVQCLLTMLVILVFSMSSWTAAVSDSVTDMDDIMNSIRIAPKEVLVRHYSVFSKVHKVCRLSIKDRLLEAGELIFLAYTAYMCYKVRKAPSDYHENRYITFCVINETLISVIYYSFRYFSYTVLHPDYMYVAFFIRCHITISTTITLVVCSKLWYSCWPPREVQANERNRSYSTAPSSDFHPGQANNPNSPSASPPVNFDPSKTAPANWDLSEFDISYTTTEDIRYELRKLYTQLQIYKTKTMRQDNPHISKRRGGKKQTNRKFSFQTLHSKYKQQSSFSSQHAVATTPSGSGGCSASVAGDHGENSMATVGGEAELSVRSPEDSSNSMEGVSVYMDENSYAAPETPSNTDTTGKKPNALKSILTAARKRSSKRTK